MRTVTLEEAQLHLGELLDGAPEGELFVIARDGKPVAELTKKTLDVVQGTGVNSSLSEAGSKRRLGFYSGKMSVPDDFDTMFQDEIEKMFYGEE
jgi:antitoxin (DNA-binding transcriptional repressor) of toxin-antitoxin stability system